ncbi:MAG: SDR family oxidoreductase [Bauldia sp.]|nr:SDR family oxidoreductase [Bauldia sp.]
MAEAPRAVISGVAGGIGRALAEGFLAVGYDVTGVDRAAEGWSAPGFTYAPLDITDSDAVTAFGTGIESVDVLVNAAGVIRRVEEFEIPVFEQVIDINLTGTMRLCTACRPALAVRGGAIINIASMLSFFGGGLVPAYSASKGGIVTLTKSLAIAWAKDRIRVNALAPGWIATPLTRALQDDPDRSAVILGRTPMGRWGNPADLVGPALFLAGDAACFVTGAVLPVDGGYSAM